MRAPADPNLATLIGRLPIMSSGKPRRFRLRSECFEWTFNQFYGAHVRSLATPAERVAHIERWTEALAEHQRANSGDFSLPGRA
jgi:hypothetical protein